MPPAPEPSAVLARVEAALDSLRTGLMIVGVIAVAALGVAIYGLVTGDDSGTTGAGGASAERVSELDDRLDRISRQVQDLRSGSGGDTDDDAQDRIEALEESVKTLAERPTPGDATQAVEELSGRIDAVVRDVEALKQGQTP